jgi:hypothetical protein
MGVIHIQKTMENETAPDYYYKIIDESYFYFPWGKVT